jgi:signal transduction histidine kinase
VQQAQKLKSLVLMASGVAHDFNNMLTGILCGVELATDEIDAAHPARSDLELIRSTAWNAAAVCRQMLAYSGKGQFEIASLDLSMIVGNMGPLLKQSVHKTVALRFNLIHGLPMVNADAVQLGQILLNLVVNASEAIDGRPGEIVVCTGTMDCDTTYLCQANILKSKAKPGIFSYFEVSDTGSGIAE